MKTRLARKTSLKKKWVHKEYVSKQGRKSVKSFKGEPSVHKDPAFDDLDDIVDDAMDYIESEDAQDDGRTSYVVLEEKSNTPNVSAASTSTGANADESSFVYLGGKIHIDASTLPNVDLHIDPNMLVLEDASDTLPSDGIFNGAYDDDKDVGAEADFNNIDNIIAVSPIPTLRIHKDHPKGQILGDPTDKCRIHISICT
ncbi:hypothetical protein Tco_0547986 [Tanacetum coccineum]